MNDASAPATARRSAWLPLLLALAGFAFDLGAYWPGQMSFDSAYAWWQARGGATTDIVPPAFVLAWRACDALLDGPGLLFALHLALFWSGLALLAHGLRLRAAATLAMMLLVAFAPVPLLLRGHVWTDVGLFSALTFATGALACAQAGHRRRPWLALPALLYAGLLRHNALPALLPFALWTAWLALRDARGEVAPSRMRVGVLAVVLLGGIVAASALLDRGVQRRVPVWTSLAQFDLAAVSIATERMRLPDFMIGPGLDVAELAAAFRGWSNVPMLQNTTHGMLDPLSAEYSAEQLARLRAAWIAAITDAPGAWLAHRWRLARALFGSKSAEWPRELVYVDDEVGYRDNPPVARNATRLHARVMRLAARLVDTPALAAWPCLLAGLVAAIAAWRRRREAAAAIALALLASTWLYALPLCALAPAAELRYLGWPCVASLLALACAAFAPRSGTR